jgi:hypothetical protein
MNPPGMVTLGHAVELILAAPAPVLFIDTCILLDSNTRDYCESGSRIHPHLGIEFTAVNLRFVSDLAWGRHELGLP